MVKLNKIYTRTGDDGTTGLVDGSRVSKTNARLQAIGEVDETDSALGVALQAPQVLALHLPSPGQAQTSHGQDREAHRLRPWGPGPGAGRPPR